MNSIEVLETEKQRLEKRIKHLRKIANIPALVRVAKAQERVSKCIENHIKTKDDKYLKWAKLWDKVNKKNLKLAKEQADNNYWTDEIVKLEQNVLNIADDIFRLKR